MSQLTHEQKVDIIERSTVAWKNGDRELSRKLNQEIPVDPKFAMIIKDVFGASYLEGYDLSEVEKTYGKNWKNK